MDKINNAVIYRDDLIRAAKAAQNLTDETLAEKAGLSRHTVRFICNGERDARISSLKAVANALDLNLADLFEERSAA